jgi:8-oxo-dGTP diphosphatase
MEKKVHDSEVAAHGQQVITACAFIHHDFDGMKKVFLPQRAQTKKFLPGVYELPGGHIDFGESLEDGLTREIFEEFGIEIVVGEPFAAFTYVNEIKGAHAVEIVFLATFAHSIEDITLNPEDHDHYRWIARQEIDQIMDHNKTGDDPEIAAIRRGFTLLHGRLSIDQK